MDGQSELGKRRWSTADVARPQALDYYVAAVEKALVPMSVDCRSRSQFHASIEIASFGPLELLRMVGSAHRVWRGPVQLALSERRLYHLVVNRLSSWRVVQLGRTQLRPGDAILMDSALPHELAVDTYELVNITMTAEFLAHWVPEPSVLVGRRLDHDGDWSRPLAAFATQLTPDFATSRCPLPDEVVTDHLGILLALAARAIDPSTGLISPAEARLHGRVVAALRERLADPALKPSSFAESLGLAERTVHNALAAHGETFAALLLRLRLRDAEHLRSSPAGMTMSPDALARSTGFRDGARLAEALRNRAGAP